MWDVLAEASGKNSRLGMLPSSTLQCRDSVISVLLCVKPPKPQLRPRMVRMAPNSQSADVSSPTASQNSSQITHDGEPSSLAIVLCRISSLAGVAMYLGTPLRPLN